MGSLLLSFCQKGDVYWSPIVFPGLHANEEEEEVTKMACSLTALKPKLVLIELIPLSLWLQYIQPIEESGSNLSFIVATTVQMRVTAVQTIFFACTITNGRHTRWSLRSWKDAKRNKYLCLFVVHVVWITPWSHNTVCIDLVCILIFCLVYAVIKGSKKS